MGNQYDGGSLVSVNAKLIDINLVNFNIVCENCDCTSIQKDIVPAQNAIFNCFTCHIKIEFGYGSLFLEETSSNSVDTMSKYTKVVQSRIEQLEDGNISEKYKIKPGKSLPSNGACKHNRNCFKWSRFVCCGRLYP
mmetsp:Transcript_5280/g.4464  ORF Transcript_5280/g.4464 Transcript_5280/m.4464 type:complete len:136 (+) Transcript_5280:867-1274(+)